MTSANKEFSLNRIKRFSALLDGQDIKKIVVLTKSDLCSDINKYTFDIAINAHQKDDVAKLLEFVPKGGTALLMGSSGVGKSTIINTLCGLNLKTNTVQAERLGNKGKHTTSARTAYYLPDGRKIIDTPGIKIVGVEGEVLHKR